MKVDHAGTDISLDDRVVARLSRRTMSGIVIREIDGVRFMAIAMVVLLHLAARTSTLYAASPRSGLAQALPTDILWRVVSSGWFGVQLFFVVSGFVLSLPWIAHAHESAAKPKIGAYYLRRLTRLEPPYLVALTLMFVLAIALGASTFSETFPHFVPSLAYLHGAAYGEAHNPINAVIWTLEVEVQFYVIFPLLAQVFRVRNTALRRGVMVGAIIVGILGRSVITSGFPRVSVLFFIQFFIVGMLLADIWIVSWHRTPKRSYAWDVAWLGAWVALFLVLDNAGNTTPWFSPWLAGALVLGPFLGRGVHRVFANRWIAVVGGMCYSIYLVHLFIITPLQNRLTFLPLRGGAAIMSDSFAVNLLIVSAGLLPQIAIASLLFFLLIERPCMDPRWPYRLAARLSSRRRGSDDD